MIKEAFVSFEIAKLLKEKGFNEQCRNYYVKEYDKWIHRNTYEYNYFNLQTPRWKDCYSCPTHQMAMKWLREVHNRLIEVCADKGYDFKSIVFRPAVYDKDLDCLWESDNYKSYEEAVEAALKYALKNLI